MQLVRYNPFRELQKMERGLDKLWDNGWSSFPALTETSTMDLYEEGDNLVAEVNLPNFKRDEVKVTTDEGVLEVSAEHKEEKSKRRYYFHESSNSYFRRVTLPGSVKIDATNAIFKDGVLKVTMPITNSTKAKEVTIK